MENWDYKILDLSTFIQKLFSNIQKVLSFGLLFFCSMQFTLSSYGEQNGIITQWSISMDIKQRYSIFLNIRKTTLLPFYFFTFHIKMSFSSVSQKVRQNNVLFIQTTLVNTLYGNKLQSKGGSKQSEPMLNVCLL